MSKSENPFVPGAEVLMVRSLHGGRGYVNSYRATIEKVYKNGNFTITGDKGRQQYRPSCGGFGHPEWRATRTGSRGFSPLGSIVFPLNAETERRVADERAKDALFVRWDRASDTLRRVRRDDATASFLDAIEAAIRLLEPKT